MDPCCGMSPADWLRTLGLKTGRSKSMVTPSKS